MLLMCMKPADLSVITHLRFSASALTGVAMHIPKSKAWLFREAQHWLFPPAM